MHHLTDVYNYLLPQQLQEISFLKSTTPLGAVAFGPKKVQAIILMVAPNAIFVWVVRKLNPRIGGKAAIILDYGTKGLGIRHERHPQCKARVYAL